MGTEQAYFVFPENMQPTFAEVRRLNTYVSMLNGVRWGWVPGSRQLVMETSGVENRRETIERATTAIDAPQDDTDLSTRRRGGNSPESEQERSMRAIATRHTSAVTLQSSELFAK